MRFRPFETVRRRALALGAAFALSASPALATWSIILVDTKTGEVAIGNATCIENFDLERFCPVLVVGKGGACAQSFVDTTGANRLKIWNGFKAETPLATIFQQLSTDTSLQSRQYGIVTMYGGGDQLTFTGSADGQWAGGVVGTLGTIHYAIQGNVLTGAPVVALAEQAVLNTPGSLADKVMAAMQAAQSMGGDGRCSCSASAPDSCGSPPPSFTKSAHVGYIMVARIGDIDGTVCNKSIGCAAGTYYLDLNIIASAAAPDPVITITSQYAAFKAGWAGHGDHILSEKSFDKVGVPADGASAAVLTVKLRDINGTALTTGGAALTASHAPGSAGICSFGPVQDLGNGSYRIPLIAGSTTGIDKIKVVVNDGKGAVQLYPYPELPVGASATAYGAATPGAGGALPAIAATAAPITGSAAFGFQLANFAPAIPFVVLASSAPAAIPFGTTGTLLIDPNLPIWDSGTFASDAAGGGAVPVPLPATPSLSGLKAYTQAFGLDSGAELGVSASPGILVEFL